MAILTAWDVSLRVYFDLLSAPAASPSLLGTTAVAGATVILGDTHFYWTHRFLHTVPWLYKKIHKTHHLSVSPGPLAGISFHPVEALIYFSSLGFTASLVPFTTMMYNAYKWSLLLSPIVTHCGFAPAPDTFQGRFIRDHHLHHRLGNRHGGCHFGGLLPWDTWMGTDHAARVPSSRA